MAQRRRRDRVELRDRAAARARRAGATARRSRPSCPTACRGSSARPTPSCARSRREGHADAGGLVVAADSEPRAADRRAAARGHRPGAAGRAARRAARGGRSSRAFTHSRDPWIVAVNMVSEGVDIPRLRVGVYATAAKTPLVFRQIVGRFVRTIPGRPRRAELAVHPGRSGPARPRRRGRGGAPRTRCAAARTRRGLRASCPSGARPSAREEPAFVPLSADVAPQMTLFGGPAPAAARPWPVAPRSTGPHAEARRRSRRAGPSRRSSAAPQLRSERHRLVSEVRRRDGTEPPRDQRVAEPQARDQERREGDDRGARALGRAARGQADQAALGAPRSAGEEAAKSTVDLGFRALTRERRGVVRAARVDEERIDGDEPGGTR